MNCDIGPNELSCIVQSRMIKNGYVMDYQYRWHKKDSFKGEIQLESVDWIHMHNSENCSKVYESVDPKGYLKTCKYFGVKP